VTLGSDAAGGIFGSTTGDPGDWSLITTGIDLPATKRIELAIAPSSPNILYCAATDTFSGDIQGLYVTLNRGGTWIAINIPMLDTATTFGAGQAWYDLILGVHPTNPNLVCAGGVKMFKSSNGGMNWIKVNEIHDDHHAIVSRPGFSDQMMFGNDGGVYFTNDCTANPVVVDDKNNGYNVTQFYTVAYHPNCHIEYFLGGTQDNGTPRFESAGINATTEANNGDGAYCYISQDNPRYQVTARQWNNYYRSTDYGASFHYIGDTLNECGLITAAVYDEDEDVLYSAYNKDSLLRIRNFMNDFIIEYLDGLGLGEEQTISAFTKHPYASNSILFGTSDGRLFKLENASSETGWLTWEYNTSPLPVANIASIDFGPVSSQMLIVFSNFGINSVWETFDGGTTWHNREGNLPDMPVRWGIYNPYDYKQVLLATELGVWTTEDITVTNPVWVPCNGGLANVRVDRLELRKSDMKIYAATHGRGIFTSTSLNAIPSQKVMAGDCSDTSYLGCSVDIYGNYAIAGAYGDNDFRGAAYIYTFDGNHWEQSAKLTAINGTPGDRFGIRVATDGEYAVIGAVHDNEKGNEAGAAYIFKRTVTTWTQQAKLTATDGAPVDHFGGAVTIDGEYVAIGSPADDPIGSVYIYKRSGSVWSETKKIIPDPGDEVNFGASVSLHNDTVVIGSPGMSDGDGKVSIYERNGEDWAYVNDFSAWGEVRLGFDVSHMNNWFVGGAPNYDNSAADNSGGVYTYKRNSGGWSSHTPIFPPDSWNLYATGSSVDILDDYIIAGSPGDWNTILGGGSVSIYRKVNDAYRFYLKLFPEDLDVNDHFGTDVALSSQYAMVGSQFDDNDCGVNAGSVYFFRNYSSGLSQPDLSVVPLRRDVSASLCHASFNVYNLGTGTMDWTATANDAWITITSGSSGIDDGTIYVQLAQNDYCTRTGTITVASPGTLESPQLIEITQTATGDEDEVKILPNQLQGYDLLGRSVAIDGDVAVVGSWGDDDMGSTSGSAYIYQYDGITWTQKAKFYPSDASDGDNFGIDVSISGNYVLIGAPGNNSNTGAAYLFQKPASGWQNIAQRAKFTASDGSNGDDFGKHLDISGDYAVITSEDNVQFPGKVYFFDRPMTGWTNTTETVKLTGHDVVAGDHFGSDVAISGVYAVVGSYDDDGEGSAYLFRRAWVWMEVCKLTASDGAAGDQFGYSVEIWGNNIIVGANRDDAEMGSAYLFRRPVTGWTSMTETYKLIANDRAVDDYFGASVGVHDHNALVGATNDDDNGIQSGSAYGFIFNDTTFWLEEKYLATDGLDWDYFGRSVNLTYQYSIIGADGRDDMGIKSGTAYIYCNSCDTACTPEMELTPSGTINIPQTAGDDTIEIANTGNCTMVWRCRSTASWLSIDGDSTGTGTGKVAVLFETNPGNARTAELTFSSTDAFNAPETVTFSQAQGPDIVLESDTVGDGEDLCWFATNSVTVPEPGGSYLIENNAQVTIRAGVSIHFMPGLTAESGSYLHALITSTPCVTAPVIMDPEIDEDLTSGVLDEAEKQLQDQELVVFPNPASGQVNLLFSPEMKAQKVTIEIYDVMGSLLKKEEQAYARLLIFNMKSLPAGVYIIRVRTDNLQWQSRKLILN